MPFKGEPLKFDVWDAWEKVGGGEGTFDVLLQRGDLLLEFYRPGAVDLQSTHDRDELYIVARGSARFQRGDQVVEVEAGDALFVPAHAPHRFDRISADFGAWVIFFGDKVPAAG